MKVHPSRPLRFGSTMLFCVAFIVIVDGCAVAPINTAQLSISPGSPLVARKIQRPLTIVLDPDLVPDEYVLLSQGKQVDIREIGAFIRRDLRGAMLNFFKTVEVVGPDASPEKGGHVAFVRINRFDAFSKLPSGPTKQVFGRMSWAFAILPVESQDYLFSYSDTVRGDFPLVRAAQASKMLESTYTKAIEEMTHQFAKSGAYRQFLSLDIADTEAQSASGTEPSPSIADPDLQEPTSEDQQSP